MKYLIALFFTIPAFGAEIHIGNWKPSAPVKEGEVIALAKAALDKDLGSSEDGQTCGVREINNLDEENEGKTGAGQFMVSGFVTAPYVGCSGRQLYHCRLAYNTTSDHKLQLTSTECDPATDGSDD